MDRWRPLFVVAIAVLVLVAAGSMTSVFVSLSTDLNRAESQLHNERRLRYSLRQQLAFEAALDEHEKGLLKQLKPDASGIKLKLEEQLELRRQSRRLFAETNEIPVSAP